MKEKLSNTFYYPDLVQVKQFESSTLPLAGLTEREIHTLLKTIEPGGLKLEPLGRMLDFDNIWPDEYVASCICIS